MTSEFFTPVLMAGRPHVVVSPDLPGTLSAATAAGLAVELAAAVDSALEMREHYLLMIEEDER